MGGTSDSAMGGASGNSGPQYDVFPDGRRFVIVRTPETPALEIVLVRNFFEVLKGEAAK